MTNDYPDPRKEEIEWARKAGKYLCYSLAIAVSGLLWYFIFKVYDNL